MTEIQREFTAEAPRRMGLLVSTRRWADPEDTEDQAPAEPTTTDDAELADAPAATGDPVLGVGIVAHKPPVDPFTPPTPPPAAGGASIQVNPLPVNVVVTVPEQEQGSRDLDRLIAAAARRRNVHGRGR